ncbi:L,D-transpeptidase [Streptomyces sp. BR123]|uniref:L,D-transpeptidase n=1 Tax=Streptomyces sp. BR123 TaxID=2749828 RepID=UPI0015C46C7C|nr:L,D-transpeptidase [Streptomyces sp. BR123]NXY98852.1 L,D-transpeptidase [Streptomyces sp. BR123]
MGRSSSGIVAGLTAAALAAVGFLGYQASATAPAPSAHEAAAPSAAPSAAAPAPAPGPAKPNAVPADSGTGTRVVYSAAQKRVWLVTEDGKEPKTFTVVPSTVHPKPGTYLVNSRSNAVTGSDGVPVEHVVRFAIAEGSGVVIGFSARVDGKLPEPDPTRKTGGIRMSRADGEAMWAFATRNSKVVVVP